MPRHEAKQDPESLELKRIRDAMSVALPRKINANGTGGLDERIKKACEKYLNVFYDSMGDLQTRHEAGKRASLKKYLKQPCYEPVRDYLIEIFDEVFDAAKKG